MHDLSLDGERKNDLEGRFESLAEDQNIGNVIEFRFDVTTYYQMIAFSGIADNASTTKIILCLDTLTYFLYDHLH